MSEEGEDVVIKAPAAEVEAGVAEPSIRMSTAIWSTWWRIADRRAAGARRVADKEGETFDEVMMESMMSIVAAASSLGGFAASLRQEDAMPVLLFAKGTAPERKIFETIKAAARLESRTGWFQSELDWLFDLRDPLVHPGEEMRPVVHHPDRSDVRVSVESASYSAANAERAVALVAEVVRICRDNQKRTACAFFEQRRKLIEMRLGDAPDA